MKNISDTRHGYSEVPIVTEHEPTADGRGKLFRLVPGKRIVLDRWDQWELNKGEPLLSQTARVSFSPQERERRRLGALRLQARLSLVPFYAEQAKDNPEYWEKFYASRVNS
jgi:hypothetical protein